MPGVSAKQADEEPQQLKVLGITDEFVHLKEQQGNILERLSATLEQGGGDGESTQNPVVATKVVSSSAAKKTPGAKSSRKRVKSGSS